MTLIDKKTILLADDDHSLRRFLEIVLKKANFEVLTAEDGLAAMQLALENDVDAVVADAVMPNMTGYDLCRMLRANPDKARVPHVILSGLEKNDAEAVLADVYLVKSNNLKEDLIQTLSGFFNPQ